MNSEYPSDWKTIPFSEAARFINGRAFKPSEWNKEGLPIIRIQNLNDSTSEYNYYDGDVEKKHLIDNGDILLAWSASLGVFKWERGKAALNQHIFKVLPKEHVTKDFLYYVSFRAVEHLKRLVHGSTMRHFKKEELTATRIPVPPLVEQHGISEVLSTIDECIRYTGAIIEKTEELKRGLMQQLLAKGIGHTEYKDTALGRIPKTWKTMTLSRLVRYKNGIYKPEEYYGKGLPSIRMHNIVNGRVVAEGAPLLSVTEEELNQFGLKSGDIVLNRVNSLDLVAKCGIVGDDLGSATLESKNIRLRINNPSIIPKFLNLVLNTERKQHEIRRYAKPAVSQATITQSDLDKVTILIPPIKEQELIVHVLLGVQGQIDNNVLHIKNLNELKKGLMQVLLSGNIRVELGKDGLHRIGNN